MNQVILIGYFIETVELSEKCGCSIVGVVDKEPKGPYPYLGDDDAFAENSQKYLDIPLVITPDNPIIREKIYQKYKELGFNFKTLISPEAIISKSSSIAEGCMIQSLSNISSNAILGKCVRVNTGANVMHDVNIGDFSIVAPNAVLLGYVSSGVRSYIGANSTVLPHLNVGNDSTVGAGAVVTHNVPDNEVVVGIPARKLK